MSGYWFVSVGKASKMRRTVLALCALVTAAATGFLATSAMRSR
ncbi:hypothetical protein [Streptomyces sp. NPDC086787]